MKARDFEGLWWPAALPAREHQLPGTLTFSPDDGLYLHVFGEMGAADDHDRLVIHGLVRGAIPVTLHRGFQVGFRSGKGERIEKYRCHLALVGRHIANPTQALFHEFRVGFTYLPEWVGLSGFTRHVAEGSDPLSVSIGWSPPDEIALHLDVGEIRVGHGVAANFDRFHTASLEQSSDLLVRPARPLSVYGFLDAIGLPMQHLVSLGTDRPGVYTYLRCCPRRHGSPEEGHAWSTDGIEVLFQPIVADAVAAKPLHDHEVVFTLAELTRRGDAVEEWFRQWDAFATPIRMLVGIASSEATFAEQRLLGFSYALEAIHRTWDPGTVMPKAEHKERIGEILAAVPSEYRRWLKEKLAYSNEPTFRSRLRCLVSQVEDPIAKVVPDVRDFIHRVVITRNYFVHRAGKTREVFTGAALARAIIVLELLGKGFLLRRLGFAVDEIQEAWSRQRRYNWLEATVDAAEWGP